MSQGIRRGVSSTLMLIVEWLRYERKLEGQKWDR